LLADIRGTESGRKCWIKRSNCMRATNLALWPLLGLYYKRKLHICSHDIQCQSNNPQTAWPQWASWGLKPKKQEVNLTSFVPVR
jgi:hypothetical protein